MTQEEKEILIKDISGRLLYGLKCKVDNTIPPIPSADDYRNGSVREIIEVTGIETDPDYECVLTDDTECVLIRVIPYLRSMSSMTEKEKEELKALCDKDLSEFAGHIMKGHGLSRDGLYMFDKLRQLDWLNKKMFDYRGLIPRGLAIEAPEGMYEF